MRQVTLDLEAGGWLWDCCNHLYLIQMRLIQEVELKASAADREINLLRTSLHQEKEQVQQLHELLALKEEEHRWMKMCQNNIDIHKFLVLSTLFPTQQLTI